MALPAAISILAEALQLIQSVAEGLVHVLFDDPEEFQDVHGIGRRAFDAPADPGGRPFRRKDHVGITLSLKGTDKIYPGIYLGIRQYLGDRLTARTDVLYGTIPGKAGARGAVGAAVLYREIRVAFHPGIPPVDGLEGTDIIPYFFQRGIDENGFFIIPAPADKGGDNKEQGDDAQYNVKCNHKTAVCLTKYIKFPGNVYGITPLVATPFPGRRESILL